MRKGLPCQHRSGRAENFFRSRIDLIDFEMLIELDDRIHRTSYQAAKLLLALAHLRFRSQAAQFCGRTRGENLKKSLRPRLGGHGPQVEQRHPHVTRRTHGPNVRICTVNIEEIVGDMDEAALVYDSLAGRSVYHHLPVFEPLTTHPESQCPQTPGFGKILRYPRAMSI